MVERETQVRQREAKAHSAEGNVVHQSRLHSLQFLFSQRLPLSRPSMWERDRSGRSSWGWIAELQGAARRKRRQHEASVACGRLKLEL